MAEEEDTPLLLYSPRSPQAQAQAQAFREDVLVPFNHFFTYFLLGTDIVCICFIAYMNSFINLPGAGLSPINIVFPVLRMIGMTVSISHASTLELGIDLLSLSFLFTVFKTFQRIFYLGSEPNNAALFW